VSHFILITLPGRCFSEKRKKYGQKPLSFLTKEASEDAVL